MGFKLTILLMPSYRQDRKPALMGMYEILRGTSEGRSAMYAGVGEAVGGEVYME